MTGGTAANAAVTALLLADPALAPIGGVLAATVAIQLVGLLLLWTGSRRAGARLVLVGSLVFIPIGLIGTMAARRELDDLIRQHLTNPRSEP